MYRKSKSPKRRSKSPKYVGQNYEDLPEDTIIEYLLKLPVEDIVKNRRTSKEFMNIIDRNEFWCELMKRDYPNISYDKTDCMNEYKEIYNIFKHVYVTQTDLKECNKKIFMPSKEINIIMTLLGFTKSHDIWYFDPGILFMENIFNQSSYMFGNMLMKRPPKFLRLYIARRLPISDVSDNIINCLNKLLGEKPFFSRAGQDVYIYSYYGNYIKMYEKVYGKGSFGKDFTFFANKFINQQRINTTPIYLLNKFKSVKDPR